MEEEVEEDPVKKVAYKTIRYGNYKEPQTKIIRKRIIKSIRFGLKGQPKTKII